MKVTVTPVASTDEVESTKMTSVALDNVAARRMIGDVKQHISGSSA